MTYKQLLEQLKKLNEEQLNSTVTVCDHKNDWKSYCQYEEYYALTGLYFADEKYDVLDHGHPYFEMM